MIFVTLFAHAPLLTTSRLRRMDRIEEIKVGSSLLWPAREKRRALWPAPGWLTNGRWASSGSRWEWILTFFVAACVGLWRIGEAALWTDERYTWSAAIRTLEQLVNTFVNTDSVFAAYYVLMSLWVDLGGSSELWLRLPSVVAFAVTAALTGVLGRSLGVNGLAAGLILALLPISSRYAQEARVYAFTMLFAVIATLALQHALQRRDKRGWIIYGSAVVLLGVSHLVALSLLAAHLIYVTTLHRRSLAAWAATSALAASALSPLVMVARRQTQEVVEFQRELAVLDLLLVAFRFGAGPIFILVFVGAIAAGIFRQRRLSVDAVLLPLFWITVPLLVGIAVTPWLPVLVFPRYFAFLVPAWALLASYALAGLPKWSVVGVGAVCVSLIVPAHWQLRQSDSHYSEDPRPTAAIIASNYQPGDAIIFGQPKHRSAMDYYLPSVVRPYDALLVTPAAERAGFADVECEDVSGCLSMATRVWVLGPDGPALEPRKAEVLEGEFRLLDAWRPPPGYVHLQLFERR
jgi:mannosyltransferase